MDKSSIGIRISDKQDYNLYANRAMLDIFGYKDAAEVQANPPYNFYTPEYHADFLVRHEKFLRGEPMPKQIEADIVRKDGTVRNLQISMTDVFWDGKQQYQTLYNDITERKQAEYALKLSEQNFRNSLEHSLIGIRIVDSTWHTLYANQAFLNMFGYANSAEADASSPEKIYTPEETGAFWNARKNVCAVSHYRIRWRSILAVKTGLSGVSRLPAEKYYGMASPNTRFFTMISPNVFRLKLLEKLRKRISVIPSKVYPGYSHRGC